MYDQRFPTLFRVSEVPGLDDAGRARLEKIRQTVKARTDADCLYNARTGWLYFYIREVRQGLSIPERLCEFRIRPRVWNWCIEDRIDELCAYIRRGRIGAAMKDKLMDWAEKSALSNAESDRAREKAETHHAAYPTLRRVLNRYKMGSKFRPTVLVDGFKGKALA